MTLPSTLAWILKCVFTCNHGRTAPKEGKCYCPDCGRGVIFQWVVIRCEDCNHRTDGKITLRQLVPSQRCCINCGQQSFYYDYLEGPSYFQLHQARLIIREESDYLQGRYRWSVFAFSEKWEHFAEAAFGQQVESWLHKTHALFSGQTKVVPVLIAARSQPSISVTASWDHPGHGR